MEWDDQLAAARAESSRVRAIRILTDLLAETDAVAQDVPVAVLRATVFGQLALEGDRPSDRARRWRQAVNSLSPALQRSPHDSSLVAALAHLSVDAFQDTLSDHLANTRIAFLRNSLRLADKWLRENSNSGVGARGSVLSVKSSLLRNLATQEFGQPQKFRLSEAVRCAELAYSISKTPAASLELGLALWARARIAPTDERYKMELGLAEVRIRSAADQGLPSAMLALPRLYRLTFRPLQCLEAWPSESIRDKRMVLRDSYIYGEAATALTYRGYPSELVAEYLSNAIAMLERAASAGYRNVRLITALAFTRGLAEGSSAAATALNDIAVDPAGLDWRTVLSLVTHQPDAGVPEDLPVEQLALGLAEGSALSALGTLAIHILDNRLLGEALYRTSIAMDPTNAIAYTNLARLLLSKNGDHANEAMRLLQKAQNLADRRFTWWRVVLEEANRGKPGPEAGRAIGSVSQFVHTESLGKLRKQFQAADRAEELNNEELAARGRLFERLIAALADLTLDTASGPYHQPQSGSYHEIDGYLEHRGNPYIVECKWRAKSIDKTALILFIEKVKEVAARGGVFFSMSGFDVGAVDAARRAIKDAPILLVDGGEVRDLFYGRTCLDQVIDFKRRYVDRVGDPFRKFEPPGIAVA